MVVLDTDHVSLLDHKESGASQRLRERLDTLPPSEVSTTIVTFEEQCRGWLSVVSNARKPDQLLAGYGNLSRLLANYRVINVLEFDAVAARKLSELTSLRIRVSTMDLRIGAIVLASDAMLLTRNRRDFERIPGLRIADWST